MRDPRRVNEAYECDHLRPVVRLDGHWCHVNFGRVGTVCEAGVYRVTAVYFGEHTTNKLVLEET